jgi:hypothetical protein
MGDTVRAEKDRETALDLEPKMREIIGIVNSLLSKGAVDQTPDDLSSIPSPPPPPQPAPSRTNQATKAAQDVCLRDNDRCNNRCTRDFSGQYMPRQLLDDCRDICEAAALKCIAEASGNSAEVAEYDNRLNQLLRKLQADTNQFSNAVNNQPRYSAPSVVPSFNYNQRTNPGATQSLPALPDSGTVGQPRSPGQQRRLAVERSVSR